MNPFGNRFTLNSTFEVIEEAVEKLTELGFNGFDLDENAICIVVWNDWDFTAVSEHEWIHKDDIEMLTNLEDFINAVKKEFIPLEVNLTQQEENEMNNFDKVFECAIEGMHEQNVKTFDSVMANIMKVGLVKLKPVFEIFYNQGVEDVKGDLDEAKLDKSKT